MLITRTVVAVEVAVEVVVTPRELALIAELFELLFGVVALLDQR